MIIPVRAVKPNIAGSLDVLPPGFIDFLKPLHKIYSPWQRKFTAKRKEMLAMARIGDLPTYPPTKLNFVSHKTLPEWCQDQRNQMTGPADDAELTVKMLNSGSPGVMLDLEDSQVNEWDHLILGHQNIISALNGSLNYQKSDKKIWIKPSKTAVWTRVRGLHLHQYGVFDDPVSASLFDVALHCYAVRSVGLDQHLKHPLAFYIPKTELAEEADWWASVFSAVSRGLGWPEDGAIYAMALVESHPLAYNLTRFISGLHGYLLGLNLGRYDYMASLGHYTFAKPEWVLPDKNTIPHDVTFFQNLRELLVEECHANGLLAIGGMTALYPSRQDPELNKKALSVLEKDKANEALVGMDGAWTGHPDQNEIAVKQFPYPNQIQRRYKGLPEDLDLRPVPRGVGSISLEGTRTAVRTTILYRAGVLAGRGASLINGRMEDLATDRIDRVSIAQRILHRVEVPDSDGKKIVHTPELIRNIYDEELAILLNNCNESDTETASRLKLARKISQEMIFWGEFDPH